MHDGFHKYIIDVDTFDTPEDGPYGPKHVVR
jgi:hypothetical protein